MQSLDNGKSRFALAQKAAMKLIGQIKSEDRMMIISAGSRPVIETTFTQNKSKLSKTIKFLKSLDSGTNMREALVLGISSLKNYKDGKIILLSDGCFEQTGNLGSNIPPVSFISFGESSHNIAITGMSLRNNIFSPEERELLAEITNFSEYKKDFLLELYLDKELVDAHKISIEPGKRKWELFSINYSQGLLMLKADIKDSLPMDNVAYGVISAPVPMRVLLVTEGNVFIEHLLTLVSGVKSQVINPKDYIPGGDFDLVIFDGGKPSEIGKGNFIFLGSNISTESIKIKGEIENPVIFSWEKEHPVMRFVDFSDIRLARAFDIETTNSKILMESRETPLICTIVEKNLKGLFMGFSLYDSDMVLKPAFPIFFFNAIQWFNSDALNLSEGHIKTGEPIKISNYSDKFKIIDPEGNKKIYNKEKDKDIIFSDTFISGIYTLENSKEKKYIAANLFDDKESDIKPVKTLSLGGMNLNSSEIDELVQEEFWKLLAVIVLILLMIEWFVFHKRVT